MKYRRALCLIVFLTGFSLNAASKCVQMPIQLGGSSSAMSNAASQDLTVVSLNMAKERDPGTILRDLRKTSFFGTADVWLLQEAMETVPDVAQAMGLYYAYAPAEGSSGLAILSRYPIEDPQRAQLPQQNLVFRTRCRIALSAKIGSLRLVNVHLDTRIGRQQRLDQVASVLQGDRLIIGGDFNTANIRWVGNLLPIPGQDHAGAMRDMFVARGFESPLDRVGTTFKLLGLPLHLDWIFPKNVRTIASGVAEVDFSDHHAVWVAVQPGSNRTLPGDSHRPELH